MALTPEGKIKKQVRELLTKYSIYWFFPATHGYGKSGVPDIIACVKGKFWGIECKAPGNRPTELQKFHLSSIEQCDGIGLLIDSQDAVDSLATMLACIFHDEEKQDE